MLNWFLDIFSPAPKFRCHSCGRVMRWAASSTVNVQGFGGEMQYYFCHKHSASEIADFIENIRLFGVQAINHSCHAPNSKPVG